MSKIREKVFVGMSGGVDSSVAAFLLKKQGYDIVGVFMRCWGGGDGPDAGIGASCAERDAEDARRAAEHIGIPFYVWDFEEEYKKRVVEYMVEGYRAGITPNPDVMCNREIKFGLFFEKALGMGADFVATGHYVKNKKLKTNNKIAYGLFQAKDGNKDQSYFLWTLNQQQLARCLFPIGDYKKPQVRVIARKAGLPTAEKKDSQGICFLGKVTLGDFLKAYIPEHPGKVLTISGKEIGTHRGAEFYTIGQRHIGVASNTPIYVAEKNMKANTLIVAENENDKALYSTAIKLANVNLINSQLATHDLQQEIKVFARVRYRQPLSAARLTTCNKTLTTKNKKMISGKAGHQSLVASCWSLVFKHPQKFVAAGQSAVFYSKAGEMLGGGVIC